jgi:hypothetical protein
MFSANFGRSSCCRGAIGAGKARCQANRQDCDRRHLMPPRLPVFKNRDFADRPSPTKACCRQRRRPAKRGREPVSADGSAALQPEKIILDNRHCAFTPHVQPPPSAAGSSSRTAIRFSIPFTPAWAPRRCSMLATKWRHDAAARSARSGQNQLRCPTWMSAVIVVTKTPYFTVTGPNGLFSIAGLGGRRV